MKYLIPIIALLAANVMALAQNGDYRISGRNAAMGGAATTISDVYSAFHNVGALGGYSGTIATTASYQRRYNISELSLYGFGLVLPSAYGNFALIANRFGSADYYNEQRLGLSFSNTIGFVSLGTTLNYIQYTIETVGTRRLIAIDFGGKVTISENVYFGAYIRNINQARLQEFTDERLPTIMTIGFSYRPTSYLMLNVDLEKDLAYKALVRIGLEYMVVDNVFLRTGLRTTPFHGSFGIGFSPKRLSFDYAYIATNQLGDVHELSLCYTLSKKSNE